MRRARRAVLSIAAAHALAVAVATAGTGARADEPAQPAKAQADEPAQPTRTLAGAAGEDARRDEDAQAASGSQERIDTQVRAPRTPLQVAGDPPATPEPPPPPPLPTPPPAPAPPAISDGAGPRLTFGRAWTAGLDDGFYGRFETEYFEIKGNVITGALLGLEGWGTETANAGGGAVSVGVFAGLRGGPFRGPKAPKLFFTLGAGLYPVVYDRIGDADGFGLLSPFGVATAGMEVVPGARLLCDARAVYRWHWTAPSHGQAQLGLTLSLNSYLWDGP